MKNVLRLSESLALLIAIGLLLPIPSSTEMSSTPDLSSFVASFMLFMLSRIIREYVNGRRYVFAVIDAVLYLIVLYAFWEVYRLDSIF